MTEKPPGETVVINIRGVVQGVGFRPYIYRLARKYNLKGWVGNTSGEVRIEISGTAASIENFLSDLPRLAPPRAAIEGISLSYHQSSHFENFEIRESLPEPGKYQLVSPDIAACAECISEIFNPADRRYRYPFTNCTNCGPRFTIIEDIPYDRPLTTMKSFTMCPECRREYEDPANRRFHAQPNACPDCGPSLELLDSGGEPAHADDIIAGAARLLRDGKILAVKGLGGFLLSCDATSESAVNILRERKRRPSKPLAVMMSSIAEVKRHCEISAAEENLLASPASPIVLLKWKSESNITPVTAPGNGYLGVMLPYTPLHHLLLNETGLPLVMTSGNISEEPIARDNDEALKRLAGIADYFMVHNRDIFARYDDSVTMVEDSVAQVLRRARGYAPYPVKLGYNSRQVLGCGAELKNTFCLVKDEYAFLSQHIGDMENLETCEHYIDTLTLYKKLFRIEPEIIAHDLHPDYFTTRFALEAAERNPRLETVGVQHHHAHIVSCMADNGIDTPVIGVAFDGTGYGTDGRIWGGEFLVADYHGFHRAAHLEYLPLPGGESAIKKPWRSAIGYLFSLLGMDSPRADIPLISQVREEETAFIIEQVKKNLNTPLTSSCGRLFDAVSALLGIRTEITYEAQAAVELEMIASQEAGETLSYPFSYDETGGVNILRIAGLFASIISDLHKDITRAKIAARFHNTIAQMTLEMCTAISGDTGIRDIALSGGVFQNRLLLRITAGLLRDSGFRVLTHRQVPANDGGISLGQAVIAAKSR